LTRSESIDQLADPAPPHKPTEAARKRTMGEALRHVGYSFRDLWKLGPTTSSVEAQLLEAQKFWPNPSPRDTPRTLSAVHAPIDLECQAIKGLTWRNPPPPKDDPKI
jgi:hypothetical protein